MQPFEITTARVDAAQRVLSEKWSLVTGEQRILVFGELNLLECIYFDEDGDLNCHATDLQMVALAAAFAAVVEAGGYVKL